MTMVGQSYDFDAGIGNVAAPARVKTLAKDSNVGPIGTDEGVCDNRFTLRVTHSIDEDGVGIIHKAGHSVTTTCPEESLIAGEEFGLLTGTGVDGEPGVRGRIIAAPTVFIFGPLHDDAGPQYSSSVRCMMMPVSVQPTNVSVKPTGATQR